MAFDKGTLGTKLLHLKSSRSGYLSTVTTKLNEIDALLSNKENLDRVREKLSDFVTAFEKVKEAHILYLSFIEDEDCIARCQESFDWELIGYERITLSSGFKSGLQESKKQFGWTLKSVRKIQ